MHSTSTLYQEILAGDYRVECKVEINGTIYGLDKIVSMKTMRAAFGNGTLTIGLAPSAEIQLSVIANSSSVARNAALQPY